MVETEMHTRRSAVCARRCRVAWPIVLLVFFGLASGLLGCSPVRTIEAVDVLADIAAGHGRSHLKQITPEPIRYTVSYKVADRQHGADLYEPKQASGASLVLVPGLAPEGKDDVRLVAFAQTLARARFQVLVPDIPTMRAQKVRPADIWDIADAITYLGGSSPLAISPTVGVIAVSYAAGPAILATLKDDVRGSVAFVVAIGGYYDMEAVVTFFTTGYFQEPGTGDWWHRAPNEYGKWVFALSNADRLTRPKDRDLFTRIAQRKMANPDTEVTDLAADLGPEGRAVYSLLTNKRPAEVARLIAGLPETIRTDMHALDLKHHDLSGLPRRLILIHGRDDAIIPYSESERLADAAPDRSELYLVGSLAHVDLGVSGVVDSLTLVRAVYRLLEERDAVVEAEQKLRARNVGDQSAPPAVAEVMAGQCGRTLAGVRSAR